MIMDKHYIHQPAGGPQQCWISIYVDLVEAHNFQHNQQLQAHFAIILINHDPEKNNRKESSHFFTCSEYDRGFAQFVTVDDIFNPAKGWIQKAPDGSDCLLLEVQVKDGSRPHYSPSNVLKCPRELGFSVGLKNQGATCYLNSLMQTLFHLSYFRNSVYALSTECGERAEGSRRSITLALQRLFCKMQLSDEPIETKELTESFGWNKEHAWQQHDIQELMRLLSDYLEQRMKGTASEGMFNQLFEGKMRAYVKCCNVPYESSREEPFYEVHVCVRDCANIYESLDREVLPERLDGDNKYDAEVHGKQPADKGSEFIKFPPVVFIHLKRFEFNFATEMQIKLHSRYEFYDEITLKPGVILTPDGKGDRHTYDADSPDNYLLFAVMVHAGSAYGGHYYAFVKSVDKEGKVVWLKYDDERVSIVHEQQAISENFGGRDPNKWWEKERGESIRSAYMMVYIKKSEWGKYCFPLGEKDMPDHVRDSLLSEQKEEQKKRKEKEDQHRYFHFKIAVEADFKKYDDEESVHHDLYKFDNHPVVKFEKELKWQEFKDKVAQLTGGSAQCQRLWQWNKRNNKTNRPDTAIDKSRRNLAPIKPDMPLSEIFFQQLRGAHFAEQEPEPIELFVEQSPEASVPLPPLEADSALLLLKHYDPQAETLRFIGHYVCRSKTDKLAVAKVHMNELLGRPADAPLDVYEEIRKTMIEKREWTRSIKEQELDHGDILIFQVPPDLIPSPTPLAKPSATDFFIFLNEQVTVRFYPKADPTKESCKLTLLKNMEFNAVCQRLANKLALQATHLRLYALRSDREGPAAKPLSVEERQSVQLMTPLPKEKDRVLYWELLPIPLLEMESKIQLTVTVFNAQVMPSADIELLCEKGDTVADVLAKLQAQQQAPPGPLQALMVVACRIESIVPPATAIASLGAAHLRVEAPPEHPDPLCSPDEIQWGEVPKAWAVRSKDNSRLIQVQHVAPDTMSTPHSHPFLFWVLDKETADQCKERLRMKLRQTEDTFKRWTLALHTGAYSSPTKFEGPEMVLELMAKEAEQGPQVDQGEFRLALIHKDPHKKSLYAGQALSLNVT